MFLLSAIRDCTSGKTGGTCVSCDGLPLVGWKGRIVKTRVVGPNECGISTRKFYLHILKDPIDQGVFVSLVGRVKSFVSVASQTEDDGDLCGSVMTARGNQGPVSDGGLLRLVP